MSAVQACESMLGQARHTQAHVYNTVCLMAAQHSAHAYLAKLVARRPLSLCLHPAH